MKSSPARFWFTMFALLTGLCACIFFISLLRSEHSHQFWASLGIGSSGESLNWCSNRVKTLTLPGATGSESIVEEAGKWLWRGQETVELDYLTVEKWFAKHCQISIQKISFTDFNSPLEPLMEIEFVDGRSTTFFDLGENRLQVDEHIFKSAHFQRAYGDLLKLSPFSQ